MDDDKTVIIFSQDQTTDTPPADNRVLAITVGGAFSEQIALFESDTSIHIGRGQNNHLVIPDPAISRHHLEIRRQNNHWYLYDLNSANGSFIDNKAIESGETLSLPCTIQFGNSSSFVQLQVTDNKQINPDRIDDDDLTQIMPTHSHYSTPDHVDHTETEVMKIKPLPSQSKPQNRNIPVKNRGDKINLSERDVEEKFFSQQGADDAGEYTQLVRGAIQAHKNKKTKPYKISLILLSILFFISVGLIIYQQTALSNAKALALDMFYDIKEIEINLAQTELKLQETLQKQQAIEQNIEQQQQRTMAETLQKEAQQKRQKLQAMQKKYLAYLNELNTLKLDKIFPSLHSSDYEKELIVQVARKFGESELELPPKFIAEVHQYIKYWQTSSRLPKAMQRLHRNKDAATILNALKKQNLAAQFLYLVLQESNFNHKAIGPATRHGIAKGAWQFLPGTGQDFGLTAGVLAESREYDAQDERFNMQKASRAGAKYLKHIYSTEAQASGLLVMAGYNYGHNRVKRLIKKMPNNPRERNFWKFIQKYTIPKETHDYVFYIFAAAVIGEDPRYFGFDFISPTRTR